MSLEEKQALTAIQALGALDGEDRARLESLLAAGDPEARQMLAEFTTVAALIAAARPTSGHPSPGLKQKILAQIQGRQGSQVVSPQAPPPGLPPLEPIYTIAANEGAWIDASIPGGRFKILAINKAKGTAVLLIDLAAGARYPEHTHSGCEELYLLTGDLVVQGRRLAPGDFHHAEGDTHHDELYTEHGCTALLVVPIGDYLPTQ